MKTFFLILSAIILTRSFTFALCLKPNPKVCAEYFKSESVFSGKVVSVRNVDTLIEGEDFLAGYWYKIKVYRIFKGPKKKFIDIYVNNDSGRFLMDVGKEYLLFTYRDEKTLGIDCCGNSCFLSEAKKKIQEIEEIPAKKDGEVEGIVDPNGGLAGVKVKIIGKDSCYSTITDSSGWFHVHVKPGKYKVVIEPQHILNLDLVFSPYDLSYDNPNDFSVSKGGCAELAFWVSRKE